jgi:hypothetical protein
MPTPRGGGSRRAADVTSTRTWGGRHVLATLDGFVNNARIGLLGDDRLEASAGYLRAAVSSAQ